jgi:hypothetical protein
MARGAWVRAMTAAIKAAGGEIPVDPFGLFEESGSESPRLPYNPAILQAIQESGKFG